MSSVKIQGSATGTANFTIAVPEGTSTDRTIELPDAAGSFVLADGSNNVAVTGDLTVDTSTLHVDSTNNRVGVGTATPARTLHVNNNGESFIRITSSDTGNAGIEFGDQSDGVQGAIFQNSTDNSLRFNGYNNSEAARIDSGGNWLLDKSTADNGVTVGFEYNANNNTLYVTKQSAVSAIFRRNSTDGDIVLFRKDGSTVGNIGTSNGKLQVNSSGGNNLLIAVNGTNYAAFDTIRLYPITDNSYDLGVGSNRFDDIYATNPTIQTSDANLKTAIASLTDAEITAAKAISKLFKTFKWNDKVAEKGDAARTHTGVIAQEVQQAMTDAGLDAGNYAFFISSTWWETQTEVPAVEADEENGIEAKEAYTRIDTYDTLEEAPAGATECTRLGIRYPELLSFIGAATEQRLASIEARLDALEAV